MRIHAINTAILGVKSNYVEAEGRTRIARLTSVLLDNQWRDIPVYTWAIEHPEGLIVIDTGLDSRMSNRDFYPLLQRPYWLTQYRYQVTPDDEIGPQLRARGLDPDDVRWVVMTHAHFDHSGGLHHFPNAEFIFTRKEYSDVMRWRSAHFAFPSKWPAWLKPRLIDFVPEVIGPFNKSYPLTRSGDVRLVPTPGHTMGHMSVVLQEDGLNYFFAGDTSFDLKGLLDGTLDAPAFNSNVDMRTRIKILDFAAQGSLVYLTTHDFETARRLDERIPLQVARIDAKAERHYEKAYT